jgi:hypothetical protein
MADYAGCVWVHDLGIDLLAICTSVALIFISIVLVPRVPECHKRVEGKVGPPFQE